MALPVIDVGIFHRPLAGFAGINGFVLDEYQGIAFIHAVFPVAFAILLAPGDGDQVVCLPRIAVFVKTLRGAAAIGDAAFNTLVCQADVQIRYGR